jgi:hypothetical protein
MSGVFSKPSKPKVQPPPSRNEDPESKLADAEAARKQRALLASRRGRPSTILGGATGDELGGKSLLGA